MSEVAVAAEGGKKRKRTGKQREERKLAAITAAQQAEAAAADGVTPEDDAGAEGVKEDAPAAEETVTPTVDFEKIAKRIPQALKKLHPVFKQAKKAETMRLIKKIRFLKTKDSKGELADLEAQLKLLSVMELHALAIAHLRQKLQKHHTLKKLELPVEVTDLLPITPSVPASSSSATPALISKAENRLCSAKNVADAVKTVVPWVLSEAGATLNFSKKDAPKAEKKAKIESEDEDENSGDEGDEEDAGLGPVDALDSDDEAVIEAKAADAAGWESGSLGGESDDDDDGSDSDGDGDGDADGAGWESGSVSGSYSGMIAPPSDSEDGSDAPPPPKKAKSESAPASKTSATEKKSKQGKADGSSSMFLPSLAAGFTPGDGDSDPDMDYDEDGVIGTKKAERKNRRGQRARQAIWEKKYGKGAKHVVKARQEAAQTDEAKRARQEKKWANQAGFMGPSKWKAEVAAPPPVRAPPPSRPQASRPPPPKPQPKGEALHPSWEAARLRKQKEMQGAPANAPKPTKIVFD